MRFAPRTRAKLSAAHVALWAAENARGWPRADVRDGYEHVPTVVGAGRGFRRRTSEHDASVRCAIPSHAIGAAAAPICLHLTVAVGVAAVGKAAESRRHAVVLPGGPAPCPCAT
jgi:hypothetical protein